MNLRPGGARLLLALLALTALSPTPHFAASLNFKAATFFASDGRTADAEVATFGVPENRTEDGRQVRQIKLEVWRFAATGDSTAPPIVILDGGPGGAAIEATRGAYFDIVQRLRAFGDVIVADQRGTGVSSPALGCKQAANLAGAELLTIENWLAAIATPATKCAKGWRKKDIDLDAYSSAESAADIDAIRDALGVQQVTLWGVSYGTQLALTIWSSSPIE
ncbi:MAG: alpha/beta fold hydrolase [Acidobacteria bacterium]|nr:alpha/beta fold hydrolase [Acidobacteriota bacterium]